MHVYPIIDILYAIRVGCNQRENILSQDKSVYTVNWTTGNGRPKSVCHVLFSLYSRNHYT